MTDLVERLREVGRDGVWKSGRNPKTAHPMCIKAADRIEQLEAEVKTALHREAETTARYDAKIDALEAEIARKDEALRECRRAVSGGREEPRRRVRDIVDLTLRKPTALEPTNEPA